MSNIRVGVLRGGPSNEYDVSLQTGAHVLETLRNSLSHIYTPVDIFVSREGEWLVNGMPTTLPKLQSSVDVIWNALHGHFGEDGQLQKMLDDSGIKYTGSGALGSARGMNKYMAKEIFENEGIPTPKYMVVTSYASLRSTMTPEYYINDVVQKIFRTMAPWWVVKPKSGGSSQDVYIAKTLPELYEAIENNIYHNEDILVEEHINGVEATVGVIEGFRGNEFYTTLPVDVGTAKGSIFVKNFEEDAELPYRTRGRISGVESEQMQALARMVHKVLGLKDYSRTDFIVDKNGKIYVLEVNNLPGLTKQSLLPFALRSHGSGMEEFVHHVLSRNL